MEKNRRFAKISGIGSYVPKKVLTNDDLTKIIDTSDEWIQTRTGIKERRIAAPDQATSDLCIEAARAAIEDAKITPKDVEFVLVGTITPDRPFPSTAVFVQDRLGLPNVPCVDYNAACSGTQYGIALANAMVTSSRNYGTVLLVCGDKMSSVVDWQDRTTCVLLGDGAGAMVLSATEKEEENFVLDMLLGADGKFWDLLWLPAGGSREPATAKTVEERKHFFKMVGRDTFRESIRAMEGCAREILGRNNMTVGDVDFVVPHQANLRIIEALQERLEIPNEKMCVTVDKYGNTSGSSCLIAMDTFVKNKKIGKGSKILSVSFGAGLTWGASILKF